MNRKLLERKDRDRLREMYQTGRYSYYEVGRRFGVSWITARNIVHRIAKIDWIDEAANRRDQGTGQES